MSGCTSAAFSPAGLLAVRFFLGLVEAPFFPCAIFYLSTWYTKREFGIRMALLVCALLLSNSFAGLISAGILSGMAGVGNLHAWKWLFILEGLTTFCVGALSFFVLPDYPGTTRWLTAEEKLVAQGRLAADAGSEDALDEDNVPVFRAVVWAVKDFRVWLFACLQMATTASISYSHFFPTLVQQLGFEDRTVALLLTSPPYLVAFFWALTLAFDADRRQKRSPHAILSGLTAIAGTIPLIVLSDQKWARYALTIPVASGTFGIYSTTYTWLSSTIVRPQVKRAASIGIANTIANCASFFANYFWLDKYEPYFRQSWGCLLGFQLLGMACILTLRYSLKAANRRLERCSEQMSPHDAAAVANLQEDEQRAVVNGFRYVE